ncbi:MAG: ribbon-helix-helix domain-containing protein [Alphaproteobacteria bacterium]
MKKISVLIAGKHQTSITLEEEFFEEIKKNARQNKISVNKLITEIDKNKKDSNLSSAIRVYILRTYTNAKQD